MEENEKELLTNSIEEFSDDFEEIAIYMDRSKEELEYEALMEDRLEQGFEKGIEKGIEQEKIEIAKNMLNKNIDIKLISEITNLTIDEINKLK